MSPQVQHREVEGIIILDLHGRLVAGTETTTLQDTIDQLLKFRKNRLIVDLKNVPFIDSTGLGTLVLAHSKFQNAGGGMRLLNLNRRHMELLVITKLSTVFQSFDEEQAAIDSFFPDRESRRFDILEFVKSQEDEGQQQGSEQKKSEAGE
jgi:anti-sigma B factor antagonist